MAERSATTIAHVTSLHPAFDTRIFHRECRSLSDAGYDVVLLAPHDRDETVDGIRIRALRIPKGRLARATMGSREVLRAALREPASVFHVHDPELLPVALALKCAGRQVVYDAHEDVPRDVLTKAYLPPMLRRAVAAAAGAAEWSAGRLLDGIVGATPEITKRFPEDRAVTVQNFPLLAEFALNGRSVPYGERAARVAYIGGLTDIRGAIEMLDAMAQLPATSPLTLTLAGRFATAAVEARMRAHPGWARVTYAGWQDRSGVRDLLGQVRAGLVLLHPTRAFQDSYPVKMFEYMAAGLPIIASDFPLWRRILDGAGAGLLVNPRDPSAIREAVEWVLANPVEAEQMGRRGQ